MRAEKTNNQSILGPSVAYLPECDLPHHSLLHVHILELKSRRLLLPCIPQQMEDSLLELEQSSPNNWMASRANEHTIDNMQLPTTVALSLSDTATARRDPRRLSELC